MKGIHFIYFFKYNLTIPGAHDGLLTIRSSCCQMRGKLETAAKSGKIRRNATKRAKPQIDQMLPNAGKLDCYQARENSSNCIKRGKTRVTAAKRGKTRVTAAKRGKTRITAAKPAGKLE